MKSIILRRSSHVLHRSAKERQLFLWLTLSLLVGVVVLVASLVYLLFHLNNADAAIYFCLPGAFTGLIFIVIYAVGSFISLKKIKNI